MMNFHRHSHFDGKFTRVHSRAAFSLTELLIVSSLGLLVAGAIIATQFIGQKMWEITQTRITTSDKARQIIRIMSTDVHSGRTLGVGDGSLSSFSQASSLATQQGNALQIQPSTDTNVFIRYYRDPSDQKLKYITNGSVTAVVIASAITNSNIFTLEDYRGNVLTQFQNNCVVGIDLQFSAIEDPSAPVGTGCHYSGYRVRTKVGQRTP